MRHTIGQFKNSISKVELKERTLYQNTLILGEAGAGKTHLANKIREYVIANTIPTLYLDFSNPSVDEVEPKYKENKGHFNYMQFDESDAFEQAFDQAVAERKDIYMAVDPGFFSTKRTVKSKLSKLIQKTELLQNYYYFMQDIKSLEGFHAKFEDFIFYIFHLINLKKFGLTFVTQPHDIFENPRIKLLFTFLFLGRCSHAHYYNTSILRSLPTNTFYYQFRTDNRSLLFNQIESDIVIIDV